MLANVITKITEKISGTKTRVLQLFTKNKTDTLLVMLLLLVYSEYGGILGNISFFLFLVMFTLAVFISAKDDIKTKLELVD